MDIAFDDAAVRTVRDAARAAAGIHNTFGLEIDLYIVFSEVEIESIQGRLDDGDLFRFLRDVVSAWDRIEPDDVLELLSACLAHLGFRLDYRLPVGESIGRALTPK